MQHVPLLGPLLLVLFYVAFAQTWDLRASLDATFWRSLASFIRHYLRDLACLREDGSLGVASAVVAQCVVGSSSPSLWGLCQFFAYMFA